MPAQSVNVLVVDDDSFVRDLLADVLESHHCSVVTAENGEDAYNKYIDDRGVKIIISDMDMPVMTGLELTKRLRSEGLDVPVIILTGNDELTVAIEAMKSGASDYVLKSEHLQDVIVMAIENALDKQRLRELSNRLIEEVEAMNAELAGKNEQLEGFNQTLQSTVEKLTRIGTSLTSERNLNRLLDMIVLEAMEVTKEPSGLVTRLDEK
jgi:DNA-binding NtrC family response regulator